MNNKEKEMLKALIDDAVDTLSNKGCNDWNFPDDWTKEEKIVFVKEYHDWNGDPEEFDENFLYLQDASVLSFLASKI